MSDPRDASEVTSSDEVDVPDRLWTEFVDPADPGQRFRCDLVWLTSRYACVFGRGCPGIDAQRPDDGCCIHGAHFTDEEDLRRVEAAVRALRQDEWELRDDALLAGWTEAEDDATKTRVVDGACILLNGPGFPGGGGCALHRHALSTNRLPQEFKPEVCWQLPIRRTYRTVSDHDESEYLEVGIGEYERGGWGPGGHDFDWYCTSSPSAHVGDEPLFRSAEPELRELMGDLGYEALATRCEAHLAAVAALAAIPSGATLLPLYVHPATLAARATADTRHPDR